MASAWERMQQKAKEEQAGRRETAAPAAVASNSAWERMQQKAAASVSSRGGAEPKTRSARADEILEKYGVSREQRDAGVRESYAKRSALSDYADEFLPDSGADFVRRMGYNAERAAAAALGAGEAVTDFFGTTLYTGVEKVASLGGLAPNALSEWSGKAADKFLDNSISEQYKQNIKERYNPSVGEEKWGNLTEAGAQMATAIATGKAAASAVGKVSSGVTALLDKADDAARAAKYSKGAFGLQAAGGATNEAHDEGATRGQALTYGAAVGAMETAIESIAGGIPGMGKGKIGEIARKVVGNPTVGKILDTLGEGGEEALSTIVTPFIKRAVYNENAAAATADEIAESAIMGILLSGIAQGGASVAGRVAGTAQEAPPNAAAQRTAQSEGVDMAEKESPAEAPTDPLVQAMLGQKKTAPEIGAAERSESETYTVVNKLKENISNLSTMSPVAKTSAAVVNTVSGNTMAEKARKLFDTIKGIVTRPNFGDVEINGRSVKDDLSHGVGPAKAATISAVPHVIRDGQQIYFKENWKGRGYDGYVFAAPVTMDGQPVYVAAVVTRTSKNRFYLHEVVDSNGNIIKIDDGESATQTSLAANGDAGTQTPSSNNDVIIAQDGDSVNSNTVGAAAVVNQNPDNKFYLSEMVDSEGNYVKIEESPSSNSKNGVTDGAGQASGAGITAGPEGLSEKGIPSEPYAPAEADTSTVRPGRSEPMPSVNDTIAQGADSVKSGTVGAAAAGFETPGSQSVERTSRLAETATPYTGREGEATARTREEYDRMFQYMSQTEEQSQQAAQNMLYLLVDGQPTFLMDYDPEGYQAITDSLRLAPAWNGVMTDAAMLIKRELMGRSINGEISEGTYVEWLQTMREHATASGQGVQAWAKWSRTDNGAGQATELDAWEALEGSALSEEERQQRFQAIVMFDRRIEAAQTDADLKQIILDIARQRGTLSGLTGRQSRVLTGLASSALDGLNTAQLRQFAYSSSAALSTDATASNAGQKIKTIQILNMLSNPKTPAKNLAGNTSFYTLDAMTMRGAALLDMVLSKITGTRSVAMEGSVLGRESREAIGKAIQMSLAEVTMDVDMGGDSRYQQGGRRTFKAGGTGVLNSNTTLDRFAERVLSAIERNMGYLMTTTDEAYKGAARSTQQATQRLVDAGKIVNAGRDYAENQAEQLALYRTFQNDGKVAAVIRGVHDLLNIVGVGDSGRQVFGQTIHSFGLGDLVAPFTRVAGNLAAVGMDYSPVNAVKGTVEILDTVRRAAGGSMDPARQAKAVSDFARGMSGSAIAYGVMVLAKAGLIKRAEDEEDEDIAALNQTEGMMGTQVNIDAARRWIEGGDQRWQPGDTLIDMSNLEPLNFIVSLGVELADNQTEGVLSTFTDVNTYGDTVESIKNTAGDLPILSSAGDFATDVLVYHNDPVEAGAEMLGKTAISSVTPNILAAFAKGWDDKQRSTYSGEGVQDVLVDTLKSRIPGLREQLPTVVNSLGEEKDNPGTLQERLLNAMLNPIGVNEYSQSAVSQEMERVREETGGTGFYPSKSIPGKISATKDGKNKTVELDFEQRQDFQSNRGALTMVTMSALIGKSAYRNADDAAKSELLSDAQSYAYQAAKARLMGTEWVDKWVKGTIEAQKSTGLDPATVITYRDMLSRAKESGTTSEANQKVRQTIMADTSMTASQKAALDNIVISDGVYIPKEVNVDYSSNESFVITQMSDGAQGRWKGIKAQFGMDAATYQKAWSIYQDDDLKADQKRQKLSELGYNGPALYTALGKKVK